MREDDSGEPLKRGTRVTLYLKEDAYELADEKKLQDLIKQYSEFIQFPIRHESVVKLPFMVSCCGGVMLSWCSSAGLLFCMLAWNALTVHCNEPYISSQSRHILLCLQILGVLPAASAVICSLPTLSLLTLSCLSCLCDNL